MLKLIVVAISLVALTECRVAGVAGLAGGVAGVRAADLAGGVAGVRVAGLAEEVKLNVEDFSLMLALSIGIIRVTFGELTCKRL